MNAGRPLRFLAFVAFGWVGVRAVMLWPAAPLQAAERAVLPAAAAMVPAGGAIPLAAPDRARRTAPAIVSRRTPLVATTVSSAPAGVMAAAAISPPGSAPSGPDIVAGLPKALPVSLPGTPEARRSRFGGSFWLAARRGSGGAAGTLAPQLGGSQAGVRLTYALGDSRRLSIAARISAPLGAGMREAAFGVEWQPTRLPVRMIAEQRVAIGRGRGGPTLGLVGGFGPAALGRGFRIEAYAQGGVIGRAGGEGFADGAARVARPIGALGAVRFDLGAGSWGAVQKGAARLDVGPSLGARIPIGSQPLRLSFDWRQRVAGNAVPDSGLVVTLGADF